MLTYWSLCPLPCLAFFVCLCFDGHHFHFHLLHRPQSQAPAHCPYTNAKDDLKMEALTLNKAQQQLPNGPRFFMLAGSDGKEVGQCSWRL